MSQNPHLSGHDVKLVFFTRLDISKSRSAIIKATMQRIQLLLILFNIANPGNCSNNQVSVLKYKGGNECENNLVGVPMKYTSSMTFCGMYHFRFLQNSFLMGIEPDSILRIWDLSENVGILIHQGVTYKFYFFNQIVTPDSGKTYAFQYQKP